MKSRPNPTTQNSASKRKNQVVLALNDSEHEVLSFVAQTANLSSNSAFYRKVAIESCRAEIARILEAKVDETMTIEAMLAEIVKIKKAWNVVDTKPTK